MTITITLYRSDWSIWALPIRPDDGDPITRSPIFVARPDDVPIVQFSTFGFTPRAARAWEGASFRRMRDHPVPIRVVSSLPVKLVGEGKKARLSVWWSPPGIDAEAIYWIARRGEKGLRISDGREIEDSVDRRDVQPVARLHQG